MITYYFRTVKDSALKEIEDIRTGVWIHVTKPSEEELTGLFEKLALDIDLVEDALDFFEVPRMERAQGGVYFFTRYSYNEQKEDTDTAPLLVVIGESFVLTVAQRDIPQFNKFIEGTEVVHTTQKTKLFLQLMDAVTESYEKQLIVLRRNVHKDRAQLRNIGNREIERFVTYEHKLGDMIGALLPTNTALQQIAKGNYIQTYAEDIEMMNDLIIDNTQVIDSARAVLNTIQNVRSATEAILANNLNTTIKTLTVFTILLTIPTIVASLYGMNVALPLGESPYAFIYILGIVFVVLTLIAYLFKRNGYL
jgi:magnesium transporter